MSSDRWYSGPAWQAPAPPRMDQRKDGYVSGAHPQCQGDRGCQFNRAAGLLESASQVIEQGRASNMSQALWCDRGGHSFSERDPGRKRVAVAGIDDQGNDEDPEYEDVCGACIRTAGFTSPRKTRPALPGPVNPERIAAMEDELRMPRTGTGYSPSGYGVPDGG